MLRISSDHADFVDFIMKYVAAHPSTKATTELLFMLDDMVQGSRDTLLALLEIDPDKDLYWTGRTNRDAHDLIAIIQPHYRAKLEQRGIATSEGVTLWYDNVRLEILAAIVSTTPGRYRADDARYLIGSILWKNERRDEALTWWNELRVDPANRYAEASAATLAAIANRPAETVSAAAIKQIAAKERRRWVDFWWNRLHQFGQSFSSF
jgi:hypothetical protein